MTDPQKTDLLQQGVILCLLIAAGLSLVAAATDAGIPGLKHVAFAAMFGGIAAHIIRVGKMY